MGGSNKKLGTFLGVFTPTILTILGVIMYLRMGWLVGNLGLQQMLIAVVVANSITLITTMSFSSVATNSRVGVGGAYFIISRTLGLEIGGAVGLPLFLSQAFSVTLYAFGLAESGKVRLQVFDAQGRLSATLLDGVFLSAGEHEAIWDGRTEAGERAASGVYLYRLEVEDTCKARRMILLK